MSEEILTFDEACQFLKVARPTLYRYVRKGDIPAFKMGRDWKFHREMLNDWMKQQMQESSLNRNANDSVAKKNE